MTPPDEPRRGEIWYTSLDPVLGHQQGGDRPCLVVSQDGFNRGFAGRVIAIPITRLAVCEDVRSISKLRLKTRWGNVLAPTRAAVERRLRLLMEL